MCFKSQQYFIELHLQSCNLGKIQSCTGFFRVLDPWAKAYFEFEFGDWVSSNTYADNTQGHSPKRMNESNE